MLDVEKIRNDFPIFNDLNKPFIYLDSASTSQKPLEVIPSSNSSSKTKSIKFYGNCEYSNYLKKIIS